MNKSPALRLLATKAGQQALHALEKKQIAAVYDMPPGQRLAFAAAMSDSRQVLYVLPNERAARTALEDAQALLPGQVTYLQANELRFLRAVHSRETDWLRISALQSIATDKAKMIICSSEALQQRLIPRDWFVSATLTLAVGDSREPSQLAAALAENGYERVDLVEGRGQFALRGDIFDIYPPTTDTPVRVEFFDVEIDSIRSFDPLTQRSQGNLDVVVIPAANEFLVPVEHREEVAEQLKKALDKSQTGAIKDAWEEGPALPETEDILASGTVQDAELWAHLLFPKNASLLEWLPEATVVIDTPERAMQRLSDSEQGFLEQYQSALESGLAHPAQADNLFAREDIEKTLKRHRLLNLMELLHGMGGLAPKVTVQLLGKRPESYKGRVQALADDIQQWQENGYRVLLCTGGESRSDRLSASLAAQGVSANTREDNDLDAPVRLMDVSFNEGFICEEAGLVLLSPTELFGAARTKARKTQTAGQRIEAFTDLSIGDYVVHDHHGIGVYQGTVRLQSEGIWRDYLFIQYRGSDKLYVPADQFDRVQKYIGNPDSAPQLNDLSSNAWSKQKAKVKSGLKQLAFDLVKLYAGRQATPGYAFEPFEPFESQFYDQFEHELTPDQDQAVKEVLGDMSKPTNMDRLLCGDVGYGKTEVAMRAAFRAVMNGKQVAFLAPTTILVQQHVRTLTKRLSGFPVTIGYVSRFRSARENRETIIRAREGKVDILVGTHRLLSKDVGFKDLGLLVIDEEQRFGVRHKEQIKNFKNMVDVLTLSATPIPRTLHMSMVGVRDMSILETPPEERFPVSTFVVDYKDGLIRDAVTREMNRGGQVYFLYNRVMDIERMAAHLRQLIPEAKIAVAHGQMPEQALEDVMHEFYEAKHDVLLCSTIIENGLDIQNANTLIVYDADRFGLSQLYQLRGRVGRSNRLAYAFFTVKEDKSISETAEKRLAAIKEFTAFGAGFRIAMRDLEIRGAGNIFGPEQSGQVAVVGYDMYVKMIEEAIREAQGDLSGIRESELETRVDMNVNAFLPESYVSGEAQRIEIYKRIAMLRSAEDETELISDLIDRFGEPEEPVMNLIKIARLRALANSLGVDQVRYDRGSLLLRFHPQYAVDPVKLYLALSRVGRSMSLQSGKRTTLLINLRGSEEKDALSEGIKKIEGLLSLMNNQPSPTGILND